MAKGKQINISGQAVFTRDTWMTEVYSLWFWAFRRLLKCRVEPSMITDGYRRGLYSEC